MCVSVCVSVCKHVQHGEKVTITHSAEKNRVYLETNKIIILAVEKSQVRQVNICIFLAHMVKSQVE